MRPPIPARARAKVLPLLERETKPQIKRALTRCGWVAIPTPAGTAKRGGYTFRLAPAGFPDMVVLRPPGVVGFLEIKGTDGKLRPAQVKFMAWAKRNGFNCGAAWNGREAVEVVGGWT